MKFLSLSYAVLVAIKHLGCSSARDIAVLIDERTQEKVHSGVVYTTCLRLEEQGYLLRRDKKKQSPTMPRRFFKLSASGKRKLKNAWKAHESLSEGVFD